jgi:hypothetical protein
MQALRHCVGVRSAVTRCGLVPLRIQTQGLQDGWLRRVCLRLARYSGSVGEVWFFDTGSVSVRAKRQREAAAIVDAVYALRGPVLAMYTLV